MSLSVRSVPHPSARSTGPRTLAVAVAALLAVAGCGGGGGSSPTDPGGAPVTVTFSGSSTSTATGCSGSAHVFVAGAGAVSVTLTQSSGEAPLFVQVCAGGIDNQSCTINQTAIGVGETRTGQRVGVASQTLVIQPCGPGGFPAATVAYTANVTYRSP